MVVEWGKFWTAQFASCILVMFFGLRLVAFYVAHPITRYYCSKDHKKWSRKGSFPVCDSNDIVKLKMKCIIFLSRHLKYFTLT